MKILTALSWNLKVITTNEGIEGLIIKNKNLIVANNEEEFLNSILQELNSNPQTISQLSHINLLSEEKYDRIISDSLSKLRY